MGIRLLLDFLKSDSTALEQEQKMQENLLLEVKKKSKQLKKRLQHKKFNPFPQFTFFMISSFFVDFDDRILEFLAVSSTK